MLDFIGLGAQKAGSTWLYNWLREHPEVCFPAGKEIHFWDKHRSRGIDWYYNQFSNHEGKVVGEITPAYAILGMEQIKECYSLFPNLKLIYTIRNPIERAWSAARMDLQRKVLELEDTPDEWFINHFDSHASTKRGDFENCIRNWTGVYTPENLLILRFEELAIQPASFLNKCCEHLGISMIYHENDPQLHVKVFEGISEPIKPSLREYLVDRYQEKIKSLSAYLGQDFSNWLAISD